MKFFPLPFRKKLADVRRNTHKLLWALPVMLGSLSASAQTDPSVIPWYDAAKAATIYSADTSVSLATDSSDYHPGSTVNITGGGFYPGETVMLQVVHTDGAPNVGTKFLPWNVTANSSGNITATWPVETADLGHAFVATATGLTSARYSEIAFTDATIANSCFINPDASYSSFAGNDDGSTAAIPLGFTFQLYGSSYTSVYINNNGNVTFGAPYSPYSSTGFPMGTPMVAPFWADVDTRAGNTAKYKLFPNKLIVTWPGVGYYPSTITSVDSFQLIITDGTDASIGIGNNVAFYYGKMGWTTGSASGGSGGFGGTPATVGVNAGNGTNFIQVGRFGLNSSVYTNNTSTSGVHYLDYTCYSFNVAGSGNIPPSVSGLPGNVDTVMCGTTSSFVLNWLGPETNQSVSTTVDLGGLCNATAHATAGFASVARDTISITGAPCNLGSHQIIVTATDNVGAITRDTITIVVIAAPDAGSISGASSVCVGASAALTNSVTGGTWSSSNTAVATVSGSGMVFGNAPGTATIAYTMTTACGSTTATKTITVGSYPSANTVTGGGAYCSGGTGTLIGVQTTQTGVNYQLYRNGTAVGSPLPGSGPSISFGLQTIAGTYSVVGTNAAGCSTNMANTVAVSITPLPTVDAITNKVSCAGSTQSAIAFTGSVTGTSYSWTNSNSAIGLGNGGTGTVCGTANENGSITLTAPVGSVFTSVEFASYGLPNGSCGSFTIGSCDAPNSVSVVSSILLGHNSGTIVANNATFTDPCYGTGKRLYVQARYSSVGNIPSFNTTNSGTSPISGTITVTPSAGGCTGTPGTFTITVNPNPTVYSLTGGGSYCPASSGPAVGLSGSQSGVNYQLKSGSVLIGSPVAGTGSAISFGPQTTAGAYSVVATNATTSCTSNMSGSATVSLNTVPSITVCPGNVSVNNTPGTCARNTTYSAANATGIPAPAITYSKSSGSSFNVGVTPVTVTATNTCGTATCSFSVTVTDNQAPVISVSNVSVNNDEGTCGAAVTLSATASDNCGVGTPTNDWTGGAFPVGTTAVHWSVTDVNGVTGTATQNVTVTDNQAPVISVSNVSVNNDEGTCGAAVTLSATASDNCSVGTPANDWAGGAFPVGSTTVNWSVTDIHGNTGTATQTVTVSDNQVPVISVSNVSVNNDVDACGAAVTLSATASDNCGVGTPTNDWAGGAFPVGTTTVNWSVTDIHGNTGTATQTVTVTDNQVPVISVSNVSVNNDVDACGATVTLNATASDNCSVGTPTNDWTGSAFPVGTTIVNWSVTDIHGNTGTATQTVTVTDNQVPVISVSNVSVNNDVNACGAAVTLSATASDNCGVGTPTNDWTGGAFPVGTTTVNWSVTDIHGNIGTATQTVTVADNQVPVISVSNVSVNNDVNACGAAVTLSATASDNCSVGTPTNDWTGGAFPVGSTTVNWSVTDIHGNTGTATQIVTVTDNQNPTIVAPANVTVNANAGACSATGYVLGTPATADNCGVAGVTNNDAGSYAVGTHNIVWTVTDVHGHIATATQTITVVDNQNPIAVSKNYTLNLSGGTGTITASNVNNGSSDNCGIAGMTVSPSTFTCANAGANTVTLTVTDVHGNSSTATATVTVQYQPSAVISVTPSTSTYTGGVPTSIYLGYGPQSATLTANATGGSGYTYSWYPAARLSCTTCQNPVFTPTASGTYNYTVTVTNSNGCSTTATVSMCVIDARDPSNSNKVILCHVPPGNPSNPQTLSIASSAVPSHIGAHSGDRLGACGTICGAAAREAQSTTPVAAQVFEGKDFNMVVYPNPFNAEIHVDIESETGKTADITIYDMTGRMIGRKNDLSIGSTIIVGNDLAPGVYILDVYQNGVSKKVKVTKL